MRDRYEITVAVTGMNATDNPGPGVPVVRAIRAAKQFQGTIVGLAYDPMDPGVYMDGIADHVYLFPYPSEGARNVLERIKEIHAKTPLDVIIPTLDSELSAFIKIAPELAQLGIHLFLPDEDALKLRSKAHFAKLAEEHGIQVPRGKTLVDALAIYRLEEEFKFPVMVKGQFYEAFIAYSPLEAEAHFRKLSAKWGLPVVIQEFVAGEEYDVVALGDGHGGLIGAVPMRKLQLTDKGKAWGGVTINDPGMNDFVRHAMAEIKWRGPCELEILKSARDGKYYLIEINPRFPAWCYLSVGAGQNLPWATVRLALGEEVAPFPPHDVGVMFIRHSMDMVYPLSKYQMMTTAGELHNR
jgi:carbamoyl-phosphate synthase large subunit